MGFNYEELNAECVQRKWRVVISDYMKSHKTATVILISDGLDIELHLSSCSLIDYRRELTPGTVVFAPHGKDTALEVDGHVVLLFLSGVRKSRPVITGALPGSDREEIKVLEWSEPFSMTERVQDHYEYIRDLLASRALIASLDYLSSTTNSWFIRLYQSTYLEGVMVVCWDWSRIHCSNLESVESKLELGMIDGEVALWSHDGSLCVQMRAIEAFARVIKGRVVPSNIPLAPFI